MRAGRRLGVDVGKARVGVAMSDPHGMLATPVETVPRDDNAIDAVLQHARDADAIEIVVGLPIGLGGGDTPSTADARDFALALAKSGIPVRLVDERLSTVSAHSVMRTVGKNTKKSRSVIDQAAAVIILQHALDAEASNPAPPGTVVVPEEDQQQ
ncbi:Holliday junction resolvase RuvX [Ruicaihuangia caeni]|uniref:Holliday junction resolvase RuvX n=1 Tax=Ruicaihuangia caeni TaxID=3042517 RepID=UPI00338FE338